MNECEQIHPGGDGFRPGPPSRREAFESLRFRPKGIGPSSKRAGEIRRDRAGFLRSATGAGGFISAAGYELR